MGQFHNTVKEELTEILETLQTFYQRKNPGILFLFQTAPNIPDPVKSMTAGDVAADVQSLYGKEKPSAVYLAYIHQFSFNVRQGALYADAVQGRIEVTYQPPTGNIGYFNFRILPGFGSRVIGYEIKGSDGEYVGHHTKDTVSSALEQALNR